MLRALALGSLALILAITSVHAGTLHPALDAEMEAAGPDDALPVLIHLADALDLRPYRGRATSEALIRDLQAHAMATQAPLRAALEAMGSAPDARCFWIDNCVSARLRPAEILSLLPRDDVARIDRDEPVGGFGDLEPGDDRVAVWSLDTVRAPEAWQEFGLLGEGIVLGSMDTGADITHPALAGKWRGGSNSWLDLVNGLGAPYDDHGHGTHTIGTMVGGDADGPFTPDIGVAPAATFVAVKVLDANNAFSSASIVIAGAQWILDPDGNPGTDDFPQAVNNSWYFFSQTYDGFHATVDAWRAAGILPVFCLGNEGPSAGSTRPPGNYDNTIGVGATTSADAIWTFSSRGPSPSGAAFPDDLRKPDLSAPGANVTSSLPGGGYAAWSGTSMATPHVTATAGLMLEANPALSLDEIWSILTSTGADLGNAGYDYDFGYGRLDCYDAVHLAVTSSDVTAGEASLLQLGASPNPAIDSVRLSFAGVRGEGAQLAIFDVRGRRLRAFRLSGGEGALVWDGRDASGRPLPAGIYLARVQDGSGATRTRRVVKLG
ncbi:S8 family peptidase [bacterium]|nr:S8 family peptidase [bacterium]